MSREGGKVTDILRLFVLDRDRGCMAGRMGFDLRTFCHGRLVVHHIRIDKSDNRAENLLTLCDHHHMRAHDVIRAEAEECEVIIRRGAGIA